MIKRRFLGLSLVLGLLAAGCGEDSSSSSGTAGTGGSGFEPPEFGAWVKYEPEGATCSDGSPYKFWVEFSETSDNVIVFFEGGGACWDYESCTAEAFAARPIRTGSTTIMPWPTQEFSGLGIDAKFVYPLLNDNPAVSPMADWNKVFVPYCTGDVYSGQATTTYSDPDGVEPDNDVLHSGHANILTMIESSTTFSPPYRVCL